MVHQLLDALVTNINSPPGGIGIRGAYDVLTPRHQMKPAVIAIPLDARTDDEITLLAAEILDQILRSGRGVGERLEDDPRGAGRPPTVTRM